VPKRVDEELAPHVGGHSKKSRIESFVSDACVAKDLNRALAESLRLCPRSGCEEFRNQTRVLRHGFADVRYEGC